MRNDKNTKKSKHILTYSTYTRHPSSPFPFPFPFHCISKSTLTLTKYINIFNQHHRNSKFLFFHILLTFFSVSVSVTTNINSFNFADISSFFYFPLHLFHNFLCFVLLILTSAIIHQGYLSLVSGK